MVRSNFRNILKTLYYYKLAFTEEKTFLDLDVYVTSHGGVGTSFLGEYICNYLKANDPYDMTDDLCKHLPRAPVRCPDSVKTIYIFGDPCVATASLFRRDFAYLQSCKNGSFSSISRTEDLEDYIMFGQDRLGLTKNLVTWLKTLNMNRKYLFINYDCLWDNIDVIQDFLSLTQDFRLHFPKRLARKSSFNGLSDSKLKRLKDMYKEYYELMDQIGEYSIYC